MAGTIVQTLILRFRDLVTAPGETLRKHREILAARGYVWWGWWHKFGEQVPTAVFTHLMEEAKSRPLEWVLFDSGRNLLYKASCRQIRWDGDSHGRIQSPESAATPPYYVDQEYLAWFRFDSLSVDPVGEELLHQYTYEEQPEFFESGTSRFEPFDGKRVESLEELQEQNRTIWFVRPFRTGDKTGHVSVPAVTPRVPFSITPLASHSQTILWLSDVHFGRHAFPSATDPFKRALSQALEDDLKRQGQNSLAGAIVSGDLTWQNKQAEFAEAKKLCDGLRSWASLDYERILTCPGNHDLKFSANTAEKGTPATLAAPEAKAEYTRFYRDLYGHAPNDSLSCGRRLLVAGAMAVDILSLNTSLLDQVEDAFQGQGFVGDGQLSEAAMSMGWERKAPDAPRAFRILVLHHHIVPVTFREIPRLDRASSVTFDAEAIVRWIVEHRVDLVLHGHMHDPFITRVSRPIPMTTSWHTFHIAGLGSTGVDSSHLGDERFNTYGLIEFMRTGYAVTIRRINSQLSIPPDQQVVWKHHIPYTHVS